MEYIPSFGPPHFDSARHLIVGVIKSLVLTSQRNFAAFRKYKDKIHALAASIDITYIQTIVAATPHVQYWPCMIAATEYKCSKN